MTDIQPERGHLLQEVDDIMNEIVPPVVRALMNGMTEAAETLAINGTEKLTDFILAREKAQRSRICREIKASLPKEERVGTNPNNEDRKMKAMWNRGYNRALDDCAAVVEEVERNG